jgi:hypothetical protein
MGGSGSEAFPKSAQAHIECTQANIALHRLGERHRRETVRIRRSPVSRIDIGLRGEDFPIAPAPHDGRLAWCENDNVGPSGSAT